MTDVLCIVISLTVLGMIVRGDQTGYTGWKEHSKPVFGWSSYERYLRVFWIGQGFYLNRGFQPDYLMQIEL